MPAADDTTTPTQIPAYAEVDLVLEGIETAVRVVAVTEESLIVDPADLPATAKLEAARWLKARLVTDGMPRPLGEVTLADPRRGAFTVHEPAGRALLWDLRDAIATGRFAISAAPIGPQPDPVPRRGHYTEEARRRRLEWVRETTGTELPALERFGLDAQTLAGNVENLIGSVEIPVGVAGPLRFDGVQARGWLLAPLATTEGALVASVARGARAISQAGAVATRVLAQRMTRTPLYEFSDADTAARFSRLATDHLPKLREQVDAVSAHATLTEVNPVQMGRSVHLQFVYETADAAGQNMTTACTWAAARWLLAYADNVPGLAPSAFFLDGNSSGDKKVTYANLLNTRGARVTAECRLDAATVKDVLKTTSQAMADGHRRAGLGGQLSGMVGYNINVANVIAAMFTATGQDIACVHESGAGILNLERTDDGGLYASLLLPGIAIGTVGGGTALPAQRDYLEMLGCRPGEAGGAERLAEAICGFALALELSTCAAMVGGQFADAHERLGRNRPVEWFTAAELTADFFTPLLQTSLGEPDLQVVDVARRPGHLESGTVSELAAHQASQKLVGLVPLTLTHSTPDAVGALDVVVKAKPLDSEVMLTMNKVASLCGGGVAEAFGRWKERVGFQGSHVRELALYRDAPYAIRRVMPACYGIHEDPAREAYVLVLEDLRSTGVTRIGEAEDVSAWGAAEIDIALTGIARAHAAWLGREEELTQQPWLGPAPDRATMIALAELWREIALYAAGAFPNWLGDGSLAELRQVIGNIPSWWEELEAMPRTLVHNDFSPRNLGLRPGAHGGPPTLVAYDWELATLHVPQRDLAELLAFTLTPEATPEQVAHHVETHRRALQTAAGTTLDPETWRRGYRLALRDFVLSRLSLFIVAHAERSYPFLHRVVPTVRRLFDIELAHDRSAHALASHRQHG